MVDKKKLIVLSALLIGISAHAQDGHYWTQQYGTRSMLLSGSTIGGAEDLGAVFYNPGRLAQIENPAFLLSASVYEYTTLTSTDAFGGKTKTSRDDIRGAPTLAAGTFKVKFLPNHKFAYSILTRNISDVTFNFHQELEEDIFPTLPGNEWFSSKIGVTGTGNEQWIGLTWSHRWGANSSIGVTTNYVINQQQKGSEIDLRALSATDSVATYRYGRSFNYRENGLLWKIGYATNAGKWTLGLTLTTQMISFGGKGNYAFDEFSAPCPT